MPFNQEVTFPCELTLRTTSNGLRVFRQPIREIALLHKGVDAWTNRVLKVNERLPLEPSGRLFHILAEVSVPEGAKLIFNIRGVPVILSSTTIESGGRPFPAAGQIKTVEILVDRTSIEAFVNHGEISATRFVLPKENGLSVRAEGGSATLQSVTVYRLSSAWAEGVGD
jgi:levanase/fructan beta-fructosidase